MRKTIIILITIMIFAITSCSSREVYDYNYTYKGENDLWVATYNTQGERRFIENKDGRTEYEGYSENKLKVTYKKELSDLHSIKNIKISYETSTGGGELILNFDNHPPDTKEFILKSNRLEYEEDEIKVNITIDRKTQTISLFME